MYNLEKVYKKDHKENVKLFRDLKTNQKYSMYGTELNRVFGDKSYDVFYNDLLHQKKIPINNFKKMFEKPVVKGGIKKIEHPFNIESFTNSLKNMQIKQEELEYKIKHPHNLNASPYTKYKEEMLKKKSQNSPDKIILPDIPDIGRYNPNYDAVRIHPFYPTFARIDFTNFNKYKNNVIKHQLYEIKKTNNDSSINISEPNIKKKNKSSILKTEHFMTDPNRNKKNKSNRNFNNSNSNMNISQFISTSTVGEEKNNRSVKFDSSSREKTLVNKKLYDSEIKNNITNYGPIRCIKGNVDFNKISSNSHLRSFFDEIIKNNNNPPLGMYQPNYDFISKRPINIYLNKKDPPSPKLAKLKKLIYSFNITSEYQMVPSLNNFYKKSKLSLDKTK
jgi:hypothetical protein